MPSVLSPRSFDCRSSRRNSPRTQPALWSPGPWPPPPRPEPTSSAKALAEASRGVDQSETVDALDHLLTKLSVRAIIPSHYRGSTASVPAMGQAGIYLEMTDPKQLRSAPQVPGLVLDEVSASAAPTVCRLYKEIWDNSGRSQWSPERWAQELSPPHIRTWIASIGEQPIGFAEIGWQSNGHVAIVVIGVIPSVQGRGIGGDLLSRLTRLTWQTPSADGRSTTRVWLWTIPDEHPHTIPNYLSRGFRETDRGNEAD